MGRPLKENLLYFPFDVTTFEDEKLFDVQNEFGPLGEAIYFRLLCLVYKEKGYYYEFKSLDKLAAMLIKSIGNRWVKNKQTAIQVILYLAECNLFSSELMQNNVITSVGIQQRYAKVTGRRQFPNKKYWLLTENGEGFISAPNNIVIAEETPVIAEETPVNAEESTQRKEKKRKENKTKSNNNIASQYLEEIDERIFEQWNAFAQMRESIKKPLTSTIQKLILEKLEILSNGNVEKKKEILNQSTINSWADIYEVKSKNRAVNYNQGKSTETSYDIDEYMKKGIGLKYESNQD